MERVLYFNIFQYIKSSKLEKPLAGLLDDKSVKSGAYGQV